MAESWEKSFLELLEKPISQAAETASVVVQEDGQPVLQAVFPVDTTDTGRFLPLQVSIEHITEDTNQLQVYAVLCGDVPEALIPVCERLICRMNEFLIVGHFGILYAEGQIYFLHSQVIDAESDAGVVVKNLSVAMNIILTTIGQVYDFITDTVSGNITPEEALSTDIGIIQ